MEDYACDRCQQIITDGNYFTVPLDPQWKRTSGMYCRLGCALLDNMLVNRPLRGVEQYEEREQWMMIRYKDGPRDAFKKRNKG